MAIVYQHKRLDNNELFYIGIGKTEKRAYSKNGRNRYWNRIALKVGYKVEIIFEGLTWKEACNKEKELIKEYGRKDLNTGILVNMTSGGEGTLEILKTLSDEHKKNISLAMIGKFQSKEKKEKLRVARASQVFTKERNTKISKSVAELWKDPVYKAKVKRTTGMKRVHKGGVEKLIIPDLLFSYLKDGWILGRSREVLKKIISAKTK
jgi:hypothetical protein